MSEKMKLITKFFAALLQCLPELSNEVMQAWIENPRGLAGVLRGLCQPPIVYLRHIFNVTLSATDDSAVYAEEVFNGGIYGLVKEAGLSISSEPCPVTEIKGYELKKDGRLNQVIPSLVGDSTKPEDLRPLCLKWDQVIQFCHEYRDRLRKEGCTLFLLENKDNFFVVIVDFDSNSRLNADVCSFSDAAHIWDAVSRHRVVIPATTP